MKQLSKKYNLIRRPVSGVDSCNAAMQELTRAGHRIQGLWFECHGSRSSVKMSGNRVEGKEFTKIKWDLLEHDAHAVFKSCSTGENREEPMNVAEWAKLGAGPNRIVTAPTGPITADSIHDYNPETGSCRIRQRLFWLLPSKDVTYTPSSRKVMRKHLRQMDFPKLFT